MTRCLACSRPPASIRPSFSLLLLASLLCIQPVSGALGWLEGPKHPYAHGGLALSEAVPHVLTPTLTHSARDSSHCMLWGQDTMFLLGTAPLAGDNQGLNQGTGQALDGPLQGRSNAHTPAQVLAAPTAPVGTEAGPSSSQSSKRLWDN